MKICKPLMFGALSAFVLTGCMDKDYDLSDIDTTSQFKFTDLVLPIQMDPVVLSDIITVEEGDQLKEVTINGETFYAVEESGTFNSDPIHVNEFSASAGVMSQEQSSFHLSEGANVKGRAASGQNKVYLLINPVYKSLIYDATDIDSSVRDLTQIFYKNLDFTLSIALTNVPSSITTELENIVLKLPKGLDVVSVSAPGYSFKASDYNKNTGELSLDRISVSNNKTSVSIITKSIDLSTYPGSFTYSSASNAGTFHLDSEFSIKNGGKLVATASAAQLAQLPNDINFTVTYEVGKLNATGILGSIHYDLKGQGLNLEPVTLNDLPDFLADDETNLILRNPQIYLTIDNPVGHLGLGFESGFNIIAHRDNAPTQQYPLNGLIKVENKDGDYNYVLAPYPDDIANVPSEFASDLTRIQYDHLGYILSGAGLPNTLDIDLVDPMIPLQKLTSPLMLGEDLNGMSGSYRFLAPLALDGHSRIIYTKTEDGWWSEDLEALTITTLMLTTTASNDIPLDAELAVYPIDKDGNYIKGLDIVPVKLPGNSTDQNITFSVKGNITNLDGVVITATVVPDGSSETLAPSQYITLDNIKVKVSGNYTKKF